MLYDKQYMKMENDKSSQYMVVIFPFINFTSCDLFFSFPGKSFGLKFIPNQSDLFRNLFPRQSELIRVNPKKVFKKIVKSWIIKNH